MSEKYSKRSKSLTEAILANVAQPKAAAVVGDVAGNAASEHETSPKAKRAKIKMEAERKKSNGDESGKRMEERKTGKLDSREKALVPKNRSKEDVDVRRKRNRKSKKNRMKQMDGIQSAEDPSESSVDKTEDPSSSTGKTVVEAEPDEVVPYSESAASSPGGMLRPAYLEDEFDEPETSPFRALQASFVSITGFDSPVIVLFLPYGASFTFKGKLRLTRVAGRLHCMGFVFGRRDSDSHDLFSPDSCSLLTVEDFNDGLDDATDAELVERLEEILKPKGISIESFSKELKETYTRLIVNAEDGVSVAPTVAVLERLDSDLCDAVTSATGLFRYLFLEKYAGQEPALDTPLAPLGSYVLNFDEEAEYSPPPWQRPMMIPAAHWKAIETVLDGVDSKDPLKIVVVGGKNTGKSTFARTTLNALLSAVDKDSGVRMFPEGVLYLDADVGQSEFIPPSLMGLVRVRHPVFGPPFTHLAGFDEADENRPALISAVFGGGNSPALTPSLYLDGLKRLLDAYRGLPLIRNAVADGRTPCPLIVNTMGWNKGLGVALMVDLLRLVSPSHVIQLDAAAPAKNFPPITTEFIESNLGWRGRSRRRRSGGGVDGKGNCEHKLVSVFSPVGDLMIELHNKYRAPNIRLMTLIAHWSSGALSEKHLGITKALAMAPYKIPMSHLAVAVVHAKVKNSQILFALNGSMVALGIHAMSSSSTPRSSKSSPTSSPKRSSATSPQDPSYLGPRFFTRGSLPPIEAFGLGIVRAVDLTDHVLYLATALPKNMVSRINTILMGDMELPKEIKVATVHGESLPTSSTSVGLQCKADDYATASKSSTAPYLTRDHKVSIGSAGLGNTHKAPFRETGPKSVGRRRDLLIS